MYRLPKIETQRQQRPSGLGRLSKATEVFVVSLEEHLNTPRPYSINFLGLL